MRQALQGVPHVRLATAPAQSRFWRVPPEGKQFLSTIEAITVAFQELPRADGAGGITDTSTQAGMSAGEPVHDASVGADGVAPCVSRTADASAHSAAAAVDVKAHAGAGAGDPNEASNRVDEGSPRDVTTNTDTLMFFFENMLRVITESRKRTPPFPISIAVF